MRFQHAPLSLQVKKVVFLLMVTLASITLASGAIFLLKTSDTAQKGYLLLQHQLQNEQLKSENRALEQQLLDSQSFKNLLGHDVFKKMAEPESRIFIRSIRKTE